MTESKYRKRQTLTRTPCSGISEENVQRMVGTHRKYTDANFNGLKQTNLGYFEHTNK